MSAETLDVLSQRLERLEQHHRYLKVAGLAGLIAIATAIGMGHAQGSSPIVEAEKFLLKDRKGDVRAWLSFDAHGSPLLRFNDRQGRTRLVLGLVDETPQASLIADDGAVMWTAPETRPK